MHLIVSPHDLSYAVFGLGKVGKEGNVGEVGKVERLETRPEGILKALLGYLEAQELRFQDLKGIIVVTGPGSFTALRAGISVVNTIAFTHQLPLIPVPNPEGKVMKELLVETDVSQTLTHVTPFYGRDPNITKPKDDD